jgi:hypothetical protein
MLGNPALQCLFGVFHFILFQFYVFIFWSCVAKKIFGGWAYDEEVSTRRWSDQCWGAEGVWWWFVVIVYKKLKVWEGNILLPSVVIFSEDVTIVRSVHFQVLIFFAPFHSLNLLITVHLLSIVTKVLTAYLTLSLLMSYTYGAPCKARNFNIIYIWTYVWQCWKPSLSNCRTVFQHWINAESVTVVCKHFAIYQGYRNYRWDLIR